MSVNLQKGQKVDLRKGNGDVLRKVVVGLGWDEVKRGGFFIRPKPIDCDASAILCINGKCSGLSDVVYFGNLTHKSKAVKHMGDNLTGAGDGDDEQIMIDLASLPTAYDRIGIVVNIYQAHERNQHFGLIENAFIRIVDADSHQEICRYNLSESCSGMTAMIFGELVKDNGGWKFNAVGQPTNDAGLKQTIEWFK